MTFGQAELAWRDPIHGTAARQSGTARRASPYLFLDVATRRAQTFVTGAAQQKLAAKTLVQSHQ